MGQGRAGLTRREAIAAGVWPLAASAAPCAAAGPVFPGVEWETRNPAEVGLDRGKLEALRDLVGGRGCVVRLGRMAFSWGDIAAPHDVASAVKPVISTLLLMAVQDGRVQGVDEPVARFEPRLRGLNGGKDGAITWRHLASQTSGYGLTERPGEAWAYNDFALALYYDTLIDKVYRQPCDVVLADRLARPLGFEDDCTFDAFHRPLGKGRLAISARDFARFGLFYMRDGTWAGTRLLRSDLVKLAISSPVPADLPVTSGRDAAMLPGQRTLGGGKNQGDTGPGLYSFNWWINGRDRAGHRLFHAAPPDAYLAAGNGGKRDLWIIPSLDLIVSWNIAVVDDQDASPMDPNTGCNRAAALMTQAVTG